MAKTNTLLAVLACAALSGCSAGAWGWLPGIYRIDIQQGNAVTQEMVSQLQPGATKRQVAYIMGTPLIQDAFHKDRWDYVFTNEPSGEERSAKRLTLYFEKDQLAGVEGDFRPSDEAVMPTGKHSSIVVPPRDLDTTWWGQFTRWLKK